MARETGKLNDSTNTSTRKIKIQYMYKYLISATVIPHIHSNTSSSHTISTFKHIHTYRACYINIMKAADAYKVPFSPRENSSNKC